MSLFGVSRQDQERIEHTELVRQVQEFALLEECSLDEAWNYVVHHRRARHCPQWFALLSVDSALRLLPRSMRV